MPAGAGYDVFLSYSRADAVAADQLRTRLAAAGLKTFLDRYSLPGGKPWQPELESALATCRALVVLLGPAGIGGWQHREIQLGLIRQGTDEKTATPFPVIPILLPNLQPDDVPLGTFLNLNTWVDLRPGLDEPEALQRLLAAAQGRAIDGLTRDLAGLRPYRGLLPFREQDAGLYFGRQRFIDELVAKVRQRSATNVVAVLGRSGSGKSSIVFAGLFPALRQEKGADQQAVWQILDFRPGAEPLHALIETFDPPSENLSRTEKLDLVNANVERLRQRKVSLAQLVRGRLKDDPGTTRLLLYVDQCEELYTQAQKREAQTEDDGAHAADARLFVDLVLDAAATAPCTLVLSARSDFYADIQTHDALRAAVQDCQVSLGPMTAAELTAAIEGPARAVGGSVEPELTKRLLRDIGLDLSGGRDDQYDIGKLPLLEYALEQAWTKADTSRIGLGQYAGLEQALEERANQIFDQLSPEQQAAAKRLFVSLVTPGEGREDTRARFALPADPAMLSAAETFAGASARLIVTGDDASGSRLAEVSHEALIRHWDKLRTWVDDNRANLRTRAALVGDREEWLAKARDQSLLIEPGLRLEAARRLRDHSGDVVTADIEDYLAASILADQRRGFRRKAGFVGVAGAAVAMTILAAFGWYQYTTAKSRGDETTAALIWSRLDFDSTDDPKSNATIRALWDLANGTTAVRDAFLRQLVLDRYQVDTLALAPASIVRAFGLRPDDDNIVRLVGPVLDSIRQTTNRYQLQALAQAVQTLGPKLSPEQAQAAIAPLLDAIRQTTNRYQLQALAQAVQTLRPTPEQVHAALGPVLDALRQTTDPYKLSALAQAVQTLGPTPEQAHAALGPVLDALRQTTGSRQRWALIQAIQIFSHRLAPKQAQASLDPILDTIRETNDPDSLWELTQAVQALGPKLAPERAQAALAPVLDAIRRTTDPNALQAMARALQILGATPEQAQAALAEVLAAVRQNIKPQKLTVLAQAVQTLSPRLAPDQAQFALAEILNANWQTFDPYQLRALAQVIQILGPTPQQAQAALTPVLDAINHTTDPYSIWALTQAVQMLGPMLGPQQAQTALDLVLGIIRQTTDREQLRALVPAIQTLGPRLQREQAQTTLGPVLLAIGHATDSYQLWALAKATQTFRPTPEQAQAALGAVLDATRRTTDPSALRALAQAVQVLAPTPEQAQAALGPVLDAIPKNNNRDELVVLAQAVQTLGPKLTGMQTEIAIEVARTVLATTAAPAVAEAFARAIAVILPPNPAEPELYVAAMVELLKWPTTAGTATGALLEVLHQRVPEAPGKEAGLDTNVAWVAATFPDIDIDSPPKYPASGSTVGAW